MLRPAPFVAVCLFAAWVAGLQAAGEASRVFEKASPSVVVVRSRAVGSGDDIQTGSQGSGVVFAKERVITNAHVVNHAPRITVHRDGRSWDAKVRYLDLERDLCELMVPGMDAPAVAQGKLDDLKIGQEVFAIGAPQGLGLTLSQGLVSGIRKEGEHVLIQTSAAISKGSSGGGLFDGEGRLVGITTLTVETGQNLNFAVPADWIEELPKRTLVQGEEEGEFFLRIGDAQRRNRPDEMLVAADAWLAKAPRNGYALAMKGDALLLQGRSDETETYYRDAAADTTPSYRAFADAAHKGLGDVAMALHRYQAAIPHYREFVRRLRSRFPDPNAVQKQLIAYAHERIALAELRLGRFDAAVAEQQEVAKIFPNLPAPYLNSARALSLAGKLDEALAAMDQAEKYAPGNPNLAIERGIVLLRKGATEDALRQLQAAAKAPPWDLYAQSYLGDAHAKLGEKEKALAAWTRAAEGLATEVHLWSRIGRAKAERKDWSGAALALEKAVRFDPAKEADWRLLGRCRMEAKEFEAAARALEASTLLAPQEAMGWYMLGVARERLKDRSGALSALGEAARLSPEAPKILYRLGMNQLASSDRDGVRRTLGRLTKVDAKARTALEAKVRASGLFSK